jgi:hypothetical protein
MQRKRNGRNGRNGRQISKRYDRKNKAEGWDWKKRTGGRTRKKLTGREMDWMNKAEGWDWIGLEEKEQRKKMKESGLKTCPNMLISTRCL